MAQPFSVRAALCTAAVMFFFGALATGDLPVWMVQSTAVERHGAPAAILPQPRDPASRTRRANSGGAASADHRLEIPAVRYPGLPDGAAETAGFIPAGWEIVAQKGGDLNGDDAGDLVLLLRMRDSANIIAVSAGDRAEQFDTNPHMLVIAFAEPRGGFRLVATNRGLFPRPTYPWNGEETPGEDTIRVERGSLLVHLGYLRGWAALPVSLAGRRHAPDRLRPWRRIGRLRRDCQHQLSDRAGQAGKGPDLERSHPRGRTPAQDHRATDARPSRP